MPKIRTTHLHLEPWDTYTVEASGRALLLLRIEAPGTGDPVTFLSLPYNRLDRATVIRNLNRAVQELAESIGLCPSCLGTQRGSSLDEPCEMCNGVGFMDEARGNDPDPVGRNQVDAARAFDDLVR